MECPFCEPGEAAVVMVDSIRLGHPRPFCSGCGNPIEGVIDVADRTS